MSSVASWGDEAGTYALVVLYGFVAMGIIAAMWLNLHPNTFMIRYFRWFALVLCLLRGIEFGVPQEDFGSGVVPANRSPGTPAWRRSLAQLLIHNTGNMFFYGMLGLIVYYWVAAWRSVAHDPWFELKTAQQLIFAWLGLYLLAMVVTILVAIGSSFYFVIMLHSIVDFIMAIMTAVLFVVVFTNLRAALDPVVGGPFTTSSSLPSGSRGGNGGPGNPSAFGQRRRLGSATKFSPRRAPGAGSPRKDPFRGMGGGRVGERRIGGGQTGRQYAPGMGVAPHSWTAHSRQAGDRLLTPPGPGVPFDPQQLLADAPSSSAPAPLPLPRLAGGAGDLETGRRTRGQSLGRSRYGSVDTGGGGGQQEGGYRPTPEEEAELRQQTARYDKYCRIWGVAVVIIFGQITHSITLLYQTYIFAQGKEQSVPRNWWWLIIFFIYLLNEIVVTGGVLYFLRASPPPKEQMQAPLLGNNRRRSSTNMSYGGAQSGGRGWVGSGGAGSTGATTGSGRKPGLAHSRRRSSESSPLRQPALWERRGEGVGIEVPGRGGGGGGLGLPTGGGSGRRGSGALLPADPALGGSGAGALGGAMEEESPHESDSGQDLLESDSEGSDRASAIARAAASGGHQPRSHGSRGSGSDRERGEGRVGAGSAGAEDPRSLGTLSLSMSGPRAGTSLAAGGSAQSTAGAEAGMLRAAPSLGVGLDDDPPSGTGDPARAVEMPAGRAGEADPGAEGRGTRDQAADAGGTSSGDGNAGGGAGGDGGAALPLAPVLESYESEVAFEVGSQGQTRMPVVGRRGAGGLRHAGSRSTSSMELGREGSSALALGGGSSSMALPVAAAAGPRGSGVPRGTSAVSVEDADAASSLGPPPPRSDSSSGMLLSPASGRGALTGGSGSGGSGRRQHPRR